jgi:hypothetical protein
MRWLILAPCLGPIALSGWIALGDYRADWRAVPALRCMTLGLGDRADGGPLGRLGVLDVVSHEVLIEGVCEPEQQWVIRARRPPGS